jgi:putative effector of murein hydrolase LrgA (UPF0299 family)
MNLWGILILQLLISSDEYVLSSATPGNDFWISNLLVMDAPIIVKVCNEVIASFLEWLDQSFAAKITV